MIITASGDFDVFIRHSDIFCVDFQIIWCSHDNELNSLLVSKCFICPIDTLAVTTLRNFWEIGLITIFEWNEFL